jgi:DNA repair protein RadC
MPSKSAFSQLPSDERPRERLLANGPESLSDAELLALVLRTGIKGKSVLEMAREMLASFGGVAHLLNASERELRTVKGMGPAKYAEIAAVVELAKRALASKLREKPTLDSPTLTKDYARLWLGGRSTEGFGAIFLNTRMGLIASEISFSGTVDQASVYPRELARRALELNASAVVLAHNHPSGALVPSRADIEVTKTIREALALIEVRVVDHIIVSLNGAVALSEQGLL